MKNTAFKSPRILHFPVEYGWPEASRPSDLGKRTKRKYAAATTVDFNAYSKGVTKQAFAKLNQELNRQAGIDKWSVIIIPKFAASSP